MTSKIPNQAHLSNADEKILNSVFDPENSPDAPSVTIDTTLPSDPKIIDATLLKYLQTKELEIVRLVEQFSIKAESSPKLSFESSQHPAPVSADQSKHQVYLQALNLISSLILNHPNYASGYNNRAQLRRWRFGNSLLDLASHDTQLSEELAATIADLEIAIALASPPGTHTAVSPSQAKLLSQAWTQRGAVFWGISKRKGSPATHDSSSQDTTATKPEWQAWDISRLEEEGSRSFFMAGMYGSEIGRNLAVRTNPYARLCAGIVKEAMRSEFAPV